MKVKVIETFLDKFDNSILYTQGMILEWDDADRIKDCEKRGLIECIEEPEEKPKKKPAKKNK